MITLSTALAALKGATDLAKGALAARDDRMIDKIISDMNDRIIDVQNQCMALQEKYFTLTDSERELKAQLRRLEDISTEFEEYELHKTIRGGLTYRNKTARQTGKESIYLCANCVASGVKTFLQPKGNGFWLVCHIHGDVASNMPDRSAENMAALINKMQR